MCVPASIRPPIKAAPVSKSIHRQLQARAGKESLDRKPSGARAIPSPGFSYRYPGSIRVRNPADGPCRGLPWRRVGSRGAQRRPAPVQHRPRGPVGCSGPGGLWRGSAPHTPRAAPAQSLMGGRRWPERAVRAHGRGRGPACRRQAPSGERSSLGRGPPRRGTFVRREPGAGAYVALPGAPSRGAGGGGRCEAESGRRAD